MIDYSDAQPLALIREKECALAQAIQEAQTRAQAELVRNAGQAAAHQLRVNGTPG